jgi:hypothetical protein
MNSPQLQSATPITNSQQHAVTLARKLWQVLRPCLAAHMKAACPCLLLPVSFQHTTQEVPAHSKAAEGTRQCATTPLSAIHGMQVSTHLQEDTTHTPAHTQAPNTDVNSQPHGAPPPAHVRAAHTGDICCQGNTCMPAHGVRRASVLHMNTLSVSAPQCQPLGIQGGCRGLVSLTPCPPPAQHPQPSGYPTSVWWPGWLGHTRTTCPRRHDLASTTATPLCLMLHTDGLPATARRPAALTGIAAAASVGPQHGSWSASTGVAGTMAAAAAAAAAAGPASSRMVILQGYLLPTHPAPPTTIIAAMCLLPDQPPVLPDQAQLQLVVLLLLGHQAAISWWCSCCGAPSCWPAASPAAAPQWRGRWGADPGPRSSRPSEGRASRQPAPGAGPPRSLGCLWAGGGGGGGGVGVGQGGTPAKSKPNGD